MRHYYSDEKDILELVALLKEHNIKLAIVSPGSTNISFAASIMNDPFFKVYSAVDERSAAYMACGLAAERGEPVIISCTGATAARNYVPALTEAYYRKLPIVAITSSQHFGRVGQYIPQVTDRTNPMNDIFVKSVHIPIATREEDHWSNNLKINDALLEARRRGGGPVHINIETGFSQNFEVRQLPKVRTIRRYTIGDKLPEIRGERIAIFVGSHRAFTRELTEVIEKFCKNNNAIVICDHTSNYFGNYRVLGGLLEWQTTYHPDCRKPDLLIHIGELSGAYFDFYYIPTWRVNPDGEIRDTYKGLASVFEMSEYDFFKHYCSVKKNAPKNHYIDQWKEEEEKLQSKLIELPFSNAWIAKKTAAKIPNNSEVHFGILNSLRMWNLFELPSGVCGYSNTGGFGIDGCISSALGASLSDVAKLYFLVLGDLATFYDLNALGNRHVGSNLRILVVNNGRGFEMRHRLNRGDVFKEDADILFAAAGHFGSQSRELLKGYAENLGFEYICADTKEMFSEMLPSFVSSEKKEKPMLFEVFVDVQDEYEAFEITRSILQDPGFGAKKAVKSILGEKGVKTVKGLLGKK